MLVTRSLVIVFALLLAVGATGAFGIGAARADTSIVAFPSPHSVAETVKRTEAALRARRLKVFARIDHGKAAREFGMAMPPAIVIIFGTPKGGTPMMIKKPRLAIDLPLKALVYQDDKGLTWLAFNSGAHVFKTTMSRHGLPANAKGAANYTKLITTVGTEATKP